MSLELDYVFGFLLAFAVAFLLTPAVRRLASRAGILDRPDRSRKLQSFPVPLLGGSAIFLAFMVTVIAILAVFPEQFGLFIEPRYLVGLLVGGAILMIGGYLDDRYNIRPALQFLFPVLAILAVILSGVQLSYVNNPLGGAVLLDTMKIASYPVFGGLFIFIWMLGMIYTTKFLDGLDGLVSGISGIGGIILFFLSLLPQVSQPDTALLALIFAGACLGFLPWNFHPAQIYLGEGGSTFAGFMLGALAVISGGKIATALLIMGLPILDAAWVIIRRVVYSGSPFRGDRSHLHFRLLDVGLSHRSSVMMLYFFSAAFGISGLYLQSMGKLVALLLLAGIMLLLGLVLVVAYQRKHRHNDIVNK